MSHSTRHIGLLGQDPNLAPRKRPRRWYHITCRCVLFTLFTVFCLLCAAAILAFIYPRRVLPEDYAKSFEASLDSLRHGPHAPLLLDPGSTFDEDDVVKPLVGRETTFDIIATVWIRHQSTEEEKAQTTKAELDLNETEEDKIGEAGTVEELKEVKDLESRVTSKLIEKAIFSDTIFRGLTLKDKNVRTSVKLRVPTENFKDPILHSYDLRASFLLVPASPSLLDRAVSYSTWMPINKMIVLLDSTSQSKDGMKNITVVQSEMEYPKMKAYEPHHEPSLADRIVDAYGAFAPLLEFHPIESRCGPDDDPAQNMNRQGANLPLEQHKRVGKHDFEGNTSASNDPDELNTLFISTKDKPALLNHPYVITRTFLRAADMTRTYNKTLFDGVHHELSSKACRENSSELPDWRRCQRSYYENGNAEVLIKLGVPAPDGIDKNTTSWFYAPFISASQGGWGPLDLVPIPLHREICASLSNTSSNSGEMPTDDVEFMEVIWNIAFSGRSPWKLMVADATATNIQQVSNWNRSEENKLAKQTVVEGFQGIIGHTFRDDAHPRRLFALSALAIPLTALGTLLDLHYWTTRTRTTGISRSGTCLILLGHHILALLRLVATLLHFDDFYNSLLKLIFSLPRFFMTIPTLITIFRWKIRWYGRLMTGIETRKPTHSERASDRLDARWGYQFKISVFLSIVGFFYLFSKVDLAVDHSVQWQYDDNAITALDSILSILENWTRNACIILGRILQLLLNYRAKSFAGRYKLSAILFFIQAILLVAAKMKIVVGTSVMSPEVGYTGFAELALAGILVHQAVLYPRVEQQEEEDDT